MEHNSAANIINIVANPPLIGVSNSVALQHTYRDLAHIAGLHSENDLAYAYKRSG